MTSLIVAEALTIGVLSPIVSLSTNIICSIYYLISISKDDVDLQNLLSESDILQDINVFKKVIEKYDDKEYEDKQHILLCINSINEVLIELDNIISLITDKIKRHNNKWFYYIRKYNIQKEKDCLINLIKKIHHRFEILIKVSSLKI
jgi:hypothetical protein